MILVTIGRVAAFHQHPTRAEYQRKLEWVSRNLRNNIETMIATVVREDLRFFNPVLLGDVQVILTDLPGDNDQTLPPLIVTITMPTHFGDGLGQFAKGMQPRLQEWIDQTPAIRELSSRGRETPVQIIVTCQPIAAIGASWPPAPR